MNRKQFDQARDIIIRIDRVDNEIQILEDIVSKDTSEWLVSIRPNKSWSDTNVKHFGLLPGFLKQILEKYYDKRKELENELEKL